MWEPQLGALFTGPRNFLWDPEPQMYNRRRVTVSPREAGSEMFLTQVSWLKASTAILLPTSF